MNSKSYPLLNVVDKLNTKKIIFCGSDEIALPMLEYLSRDSMISICGILSQPDRRSGRGRKLKANPIKDWALHEGLEVRTPERPTQNEIEWLREVAADLVLVMAYGHILSQEFLNCAPLGCYNLHASLLPKYRGASPIETALANGLNANGSENSGSLLSTIRLYRIVILPRWKDILLISGGS